MKKEVMRTVLVCDWCGTEVNVRSYTFRRKFYDGHKNDEEDVSLELCKRCQCKAYEILKSSDPSLMGEPVCQKKELKS